MHPHAHDECADATTQQKEQKDNVNASETGTVATLISNDCSKVMLASKQFPALLWQPLSIIVCMSLLYSLLGVSSLAGLAIILVLLPFQVSAAKRLAQVRERGRDLSDYRVGLMHEFLVAIRTVKLLTWEKAFFKKVRSLSCVSKSKLSTDIKHYN